jgi:hypothetical protein
MRPLLLATLLMAITPAAHAGDVDITVPEPTKLRLLGFTQDGKHLAYAETSREEDVGGATSDFEEMTFYVRADPNGRLQQRYQGELDGRDGDKTPEDEGYPIPTIWTRHPPVEQWEAWEEAHPLVPAQPPLENDSWDDTPATYETRGFSLTARKVDGRKCAVVFSLSSPGLPVKELTRRKCVEGQSGPADLLLQAAWSQDGTRLALTVSHRGFSSVETYYNDFTALKVLDLEKLAQVELLDAGAGKDVDKLARKVSTAGLKVARKGKAQTPRERTELFFAPGFEGVARKLASALGVPAEAVKPRDWQAPYALTVAAGPTR